MPSTFFTTPTFPSFFSKEEKQKRKRKPYKKVTEESRIFAATKTKSTYKL